MALLFGSRARGGDTHTADIDLAVDARRGAELDRLTLIRELSAASKHSVDLVDLSPGRRVGYPLLKAVTRDGMLVYEGEPHAEPEFRTRALLQLSLDRPYYERMRDAYLDHLSSAGGG